MWLINKQWVHFFQYLGVDFNCIAFYLLFSSLYSRDQNTMCSISGCLISIQMIRFIT